MVEVFSLSKVFVDSRHASLQHTVLSNVSFRLEPGEVLGIIGPNGAGKSTLLKILTGTLRPSSGSVKISGRLGSVLDIGSGFHPDLTGHENIYMQGRLMGFSTSEIKERYGAIVDFSGVANKAIQRPVKYYSSGMYLRLAFSVVAMLQTDLLILDETMSVGDVAFRLQCEAWLKEYVRKGNTLIIAGHNVSEIENVANRCLWLREGIVKMDAPVREVSKAYLLDTMPFVTSDSALPADPDEPQTAADTFVTDWRPHDFSGTDGKLQIMNLRLENSAGRPTNLLEVDDAFSIIITMRTTTQVHSVQPIVKIHSLHGHPLVVLSPMFAPDYVPHPTPLGVQEAVFRYRTSWLHVGTYMVGFSIAINQSEHLGEWYPVMHFDVAMPAYQASTKWKGQPTAVRYLHGYEQNFIGNSSL